MILTFACKETEKIFNRNYSKKLPQAIQRAAFKKLSMLNRSVDLSDLRIPPLYPGVVLYDEFLHPLKISQNQIARDLGVSPRRINEIIHGKRSITADTALRFSLFFGNSSQFWVGLQMDSDLDMAEDKCRFLSPTT